MASEHPPSSSRTLWMLAAVAGLAGAGFFINGQLNHPQRPKHAPVVSDESRVGSPSGPLVTRTAAAKVAAPAANGDAPYLDPADDFINQHYPNQVAPVITFVPKFTEADKEKAAREQFPEYAAMQDAVEAERKRLGVKDDGTPAQP